MKKNGLFVDEAGNKKWYKNDELHREDGPAIEWTNGDKWWCINGYFHKEDGPAIEYTYGEKEWWYHGERIYCFSNEEFFLYLRKQKLKGFW